MKHTNILLTLALLGMLALAATIMADVPTMMNYQGRLSDDAGNPVTDDQYDVTFKIYNETSTELWSESHKTTTTDGFFSVQLGSNGSPLTEDVFDYDECWLGITVGFDPELTPRIRLITVPYAFRTATVDGAEGGTITSDLTVMNDLGLGSPTQDGDLHIYQNGSANPVITAGNYLSMGGELDILDENGNNLISLEADGHGGGGYVRVTGGTSSEYFKIDGNYNGTGDPYVSITGSGSSTNFNTNETGDNSVQLPFSAVNSIEILDEPGISRESSNPVITLTTAMTDIETVSITIPSSGYILVQGHSNIRISGATSENYTYLQIDESSGGSPTSPYYTMIGMSSYPSTGHHYYPVSVQRIYFKTAGTYTFRLEGSKADLTHDIVAYRATATALYFPTDYGKIKSYVSNPAGFEDAQPVEMIVDDDNPTVTETMYEVDLRELELKASRAREAALKAERDLYKAQSQQDSNNQSE
ncbi:MAG: hypothetical protein J7J98_05795 [candidate division Zixibacteria bacterium]|nr:hypothetical protein [candidate division Zixibacteria bacterium]